MTTDLMNSVLEYNSPAYQLRNELIEKDYDPSVWTEMEDTSYLRAMTGSPWFQSVGLAIPTTATDADLLVAMRGSRALHQSDAWVRGDIINWIRDNRYGGGDIPRETLEKFADELGVASAKRLLNNATTAKAWPLAQRHPAGELSYSHHEELNAYPDAERQAWAQRAASEGMTIAVLRQALQDDIVTVDSNGTQVVGAIMEEVSFASEKLNKRQAIKIIAASIESEAQKGKSVRLAAENVLANYLALGMLRLPARAWVETMGIVSNGAGTEEGEGDND